MIKVELYETNRRLQAFKMNGHANSGPYGYDLVCAGVSAIAFGAVNALIEICDFTPIIEQKDSGFLYVELPADKANNPEAQTILKAMVVSLQTIEREYKQFIQITSK